MGAQWNQMGADLMKIPVFRKTVERCNTILKPQNVDLIKIITSDDPTVLENILHVFLGIGIVQIGMINILKELIVEPDFILAPSFGEIACGYFDSCLTEEQAILAAYYRGTVCLKELPFVGGMAFVGVGIKHLEHLLPEGLEAPCLNTASGCIVAGPLSALDSFLKTLEKLNIISSKLDCCNIPFHTSYITEFGPLLVSHLQKVIPSPKKRSEKWRSTSDPFGKYGELCSAEYYANNLCGNVYFEETSRLLPRNCISLEVGPSGQLFKSLKLTIPNGDHFALGQRDNIEAAKFFMDTLKE